MEERMKKSSTNTAPNGRSPPISIAGTSLRYHACGGTSRGIWLVLHGTSITGCRYPRYAPRKVSGTEIQNHITITASSVPIGTAPEDWCVQMRRFSAKKIAAHAPGKTKAVRKVTLILFSSANSFENRAATNPEAAPERRKNTTVPPSSDPLCAGEKNPRAARMRVRIDMSSSCIPVATYTERSWAIGGGREISPCTSFQPVSSRSAWGSSGASALYFWRSLRRMREKIMPTIPERKTRITIELMIENQWMLSLVIER
mmetsp:Transcript_42627/g.101457  ORF Transcript_42627/g.101457 Transcript_42627/m.101457 type:complete len:258 (+) Transcript_42627:381-1154(+)